MAVIVRLTVRGMDQSHYDEMSGEYLDFVRKAPGFQSHEAEVGEDATTISEVWETEVQFRKFFEGIGRWVFPPPFDPTAKVAELDDAK